MWLHWNNTQHNTGQFIFVSTGDSIFGRHKRGCQGGAKVHHLIVTTTISFQ